MIGSLVLGKVEGEGLGATLLLPAGFVTGSLVLGNVEGEGVMTS